MADDFGSTVSTTTGRVLVGGSITGQLEQVGDLDWFAVTLLADRDYIFTLEPGTTEPLEDPYLKLYSSDGSTLVGESDDANGLDSEIGVAITTSGTYYLEASSGTSGTETGSYVLAASLPIMDDYAASISTAGSIVVGGSATGQLEIVGDSDWFAISLLAGKQYTFTLEPGSTDGLPDPMLALYRSDGSLVAANDDSDGLNSQISFTVSTTGTYYLGASSGPNDIGTGTYTLRASLPITDDYAATIKTTGQVTAGGSASGQLESSGDSDWLAISLAAGQQYTFSLDSGATNGLTDPFLSLYDKNGTLITSDDDSDALNPRITSYTPSETATYYLGASISPNDTGAGTGSYTVSVSLPSVNGITVTGGTSSDETFFAGTSDAVVDGGTGVDSVVFSSNRSQYTITKTATGYKVFDNTGQNDINTLFNTELLKFADQTIDTRVVNADSYETVVQQLYVAYFGRPADSGGLTNFENALRDANAPTDITGLAQAYNTDATVRGLIETFGLSAESARLYTGATSDFVTAIFNHVLNRAPASAGLSFWTEAIDSGRLSKANAALSIMQGAVTNTSTQGLLDAAAVYNKIAVASNFTFNIDTSTEISGYVGADAGATAREMLQVVDDASNPIELQSTVTSTLSSLAGSASSSALGFAGQDTGHATLIGVADQTI